MDVHGAGGLKHSALARAGQGTPFAHEMRGRSVESKLGDPVLRLQHDISPGLRRVEIEVARTETVIAAGRDDNPARQGAARVIEQPEAAGRVRPAGRTEAAVGQDGRAVIRPNPHLVNVAPRGDLVGLVDLSAETAVRVRAVDLHAAGIGECDENVFGGDVGGQVYWPGRQGNRIATRR